MFAGKEMRMSNLEKPLHIDIPVRLPEVKVAFSIAALAFEGDLPASIFHLQLISKDVDAVERKRASNCCLSYKCRPCNFERRCLQCRTNGIDRQPVQGTRC